MSDPATGIARPSAFRRTWAVFRLAFSFWGDARAYARAARLPTDRREQVRRQIWRRAGERLRDRALSLGGLIIKVGQFLSARADLFPAEFLRPLQALQDQVPPAPWAAVAHRLAEAYGPGWEQALGPVEEQALAAASLGQVHRGRLAATGEPVALKIQRPGIETLVAVDLGALRRVLRVVERVVPVARRLGAMALLAEFESMVYRELDYQREAEAMEAFARHYRNQPGLYVPMAYREWTRRTVLVMEYVEGARFTDVVAGPSPETLARRLIDLYLDQILVQGLVQVDPHPGNFLVDATGRLVLLDFGMVMEFSAAERQWMTRLVMAAVVGRAGAVVAALEALGFIRPEADRVLLRQALSLLLRQLGQARLEPGPETERLAAVVQEFVYEKPLQFPARYLFLGRALGILFGLLTRLAADLDWVAVLREEGLPRVARVQEDGAGGAWEAWVGALLGAIGGEQAAWAGQQWAQALAETWRRWRELPGRIAELAEQWEGGTVPTRPQWSPLLRRLDRLERRLAQLNWTVLATLLAAGAYLHPWAGDGQLAWALYALAALAFVKGWWSGRSGRS